MNKCAKCKTDLTFSTAEGRHMIGSKPVCDDCYFNELGDEVEQFPIGGFRTPRQTRG
jgi:hypothetical protein